MTTQSDIIHAVAAKHDCIEQVIHNAAPIIALSYFELFDCARLLDAVMHPEQTEGYLTPNDLAALDYGDFDLGTRTVISGGEILELGNHKEDVNEDNLPF